MHEDSDLIREFQHGDEKSFDKLVKKHLDNVFGFFLKVTRDKMAAEDLAQDVFIKLYKNLINFRHESSFSTYLFRINANTANSWITRKKWKNIRKYENLTRKMKKRGNGKEKPGKRGK